MQGGTGESEETAQRLQLQSQYRTGMLVARHGMMVAEGDTERKV